MGDLANSMMLEGLPPPPTDQLRAPVPEHSAVYCMDLRAEDT